MLRPVDGCTLIEQTDIVLNESKNVINTCPQTCRRRAPRSISRPTPLGKASGRPWRRTCKTRRPLPSRRRTCAREAAAQQANQSECAPASPPRVVGDDGGFGTERRLDEYFAMLRGRVILMRFNGCFWVLFLSLILQLGCLTEENFWDGDVVDTNNKRAFVYYNVN